MDAASCGLKVDNSHGMKLVEVGERIKRAVRATHTPIHPQNPSIRGVTVLAWTHPLEETAEGKTALNTVVASPGRFDRSPCGTGTCARMAVLHARGQLNVGETFIHKSIIGTKFINHIRGTTTIHDINSREERPAVLPTVKGRAWISHFKQVVLDPEDPFPTGFRVGDSWGLEFHH